MAVNRNREIREGWTVGMVADDIGFLAAMIQRGEAMHKPFKSEAEMASWLKSEKPNLHLTAKDARDICRCIEEDCGIRFDTERER